MFQVTKAHVIKPFVKLTAMDKGHAWIPNGNGEYIKATIVGHHKDNNIHLLVVKTEKGEFFEYKEDGTPYGNTGSSFSLCLICEFSIKKIAVYYQVSERKNDHTVKFLASYLGISIPKVPTSTTLLPGLAKTPVSTKYGIMEVEIETYI